MPSDQVNPFRRRPLNPGAVAWMLMLCLSWGFNQIAVKLTLPDVPPMLQATIRSAGALPVLLLIARLRGVRLFERDGTLGAGLFAGLLFGLEFVLLFHGLQADLGLARGGVSLHRAVLCGTRLLPVSRRAAARVAMGWARPELCRRGAGDRRSAGRCRRRVLLGDLLVVAPARCGPPPRWW